MKRQCPFCHEYVSIFTYSWHLSKHELRGEDGQMADHATLPPDQRDASNTEDEPRVYIHHRCGQCTEMPEEIIQTYLANPYFYNSSTFCTGCETYVQEAECEWVETGQSLAEHKRQLKQAMPWGTRLKCIVLALLFR